MSWKDELVTSKEEAFDFLRRHLHEAGLSPFMLKDLGDEGGEDSYAAPHAHRCGPKNEILFFDVNHPEDGVCVIDGFYVGRLFRHKNLQLGAIAAKAMVGISYELSAQAIELPFVNRDGSSFWSYMGATPYATPVALSETIREVLYKTKPVLTRNDRKLLQEIVPMAKDNPYAGWRKLSQISGLSKQGKKARHEIFDQICFKDSLFIIPGETSTRPILESRLGCQPAFRPLMKEHKLYHIQQYLCDQ